MKKKKEKKIKSICNQGHRQWSSFEVLYHHQRFEDKLPTGLMGLSWEICFIRCFLLQFWEIFAFRSPDHMQVQSGLGVSHGSKNLFPGVWQHSIC